MAIEEEVVVSICRKRGFSTLMTLSWIFAPNLVLHLVFLKVNLLLPNFTNLSQWAPVNHHSAVVPQLMSLMFFPPGILLNSFFCSIKFWFILSRSGARLFSIIASSCLVCSCPVYLAAILHVSISVSAYLLSGIY